MFEEFNVPDDSLWYKDGSGWPKEVPHNLELSGRTLGQMLDDSVSKHPDDTAIWFLDTFMTYKKLKEHVDSLATAFHLRGIKKGDVIALILPNSFQYVITFFAAQKIGAVATGVNPTYKPGEVLHQLKETGACAIVTLDALYEQIVAPIYKELDLKFIVGTNVVDLAGISGFKKFLGKLLGKIPKGTLPPESLSFTDLLRTPANLPQVEIDVKEDPALYQMTGGTTGVPKAAVLTHLNLVSNAEQSVAWLHKAQHDTGMVGVLPLFHSFASTAVMNCAVNLGGWMMLFPKPPAQEELVATFLRLPAPGGLIYCGAEILFQRLADYVEKNPSFTKPLSEKISLCISGAGPLHRPVQEKFERVTGGKLVEGYGLTESSPVVSAGPFYEGRKIGTIGLPFPNTEWRIMDREDFAKGEMAQGEIGEICVAGPQVMKGYLNREDETGDHIKEYQGKMYLLTGDIGRMDELGRVTIEDRKKQLIKHKGYSVFPKEVESLVGNHPDVVEVAAAGIPDEKVGEIIKAWVVLKDEAKGTLTTDALREWCKENMTHYKVPSEIEFRDELPKTLVGKVLRRVLQEEDARYMAKLEAEKK